jgi:hypothetical protein
MSQFRLPKRLLGRCSEIVESEGHVLWMHSLADFSTESKKVRIAARVKQWKTALSMFALATSFALAVCDISGMTISQGPDDECQGEFDLGTRISSA